MYVMQSNIVHNCSGGGSSLSAGIAVVVIKIAHKHTFRFKEQRILTSRAVFAYHLPRIGILNENSDSTAHVCGGRVECAIILSIFSYIFRLLYRHRPVFTLSVSLNALSVGNGI